MSISAKGQGTFPAKNSSKEAEEAKLYWGDPSATQLRLLTTERHCNMLNVS